MPLWGRPRGALTASLNWYRALELDGDLPADPSPIAQRVLYIYGTRDLQVFVNPGVQSRMSKYVSGPFEHIGLKAGHWLIQDQEKAVVDALMTHLQAAR